MSTVLSPATVEYPSTDGKPVAESDFQRDYLWYAVGVLQQYFRARQDVYVSGNLLLYYDEGNPAASVAPDVFVVLGASNHRRTSYLLWQEPKAPDFVLEVTSRSTRKEDQGPKRELYRRLGVREYWQYDPTGDYLEPALQGCELRGGEYEALPAAERGAGRLVLRSAVLGLELRLEAGSFAFTMRQRAPPSTPERNWKPVSAWKPPRDSGRLLPGARPRRGWPNSRGTSVSSATAPHTIRTARPN